MTYAVEDFCRDTRTAIDPRSRNADIEAVRAALEKLLANPQFVSEQCGPQAKIGVHTIFHDPQTDFMLLAHINEAGRTSPPHDHGASWAVYGQAIGWTEMTDYERLDDGSKEGQAELKVTRKYRLDPGKAGIFGPHQVHSIHFPDGARFIRVTGTDLTKIETLRYDMANRKVLRNDPNREGVAAGSGAV